MTDRAREAAAEAAADAYPRIVAALIRITGDWTLAEDSAQEALATALARWPASGVPANQDTSHSRLAPEPASRQWPVSRPRHISGASSMPFSWNHSRR